MNLNADNDIIYSLIGCPSVLLTLDDLCLLRIYVTTISSSSISAQLTELKNTSFILEMQKRCVYIDDNIIKCEWLI